MRVNRSARAPTKQTKPPRRQAAPSGLINPDQTTPNTLSKISVIPPSRPRSPAPPRVTHPRSHKGQEKTIASLPPSSPPLPPSPPAAPRLGSSAIDVNRQHCTLSPSPFPSPAPAPLTPTLTQPDHVQNVIGRRFLLAIRSTCCPRVSFSWRRRPGTKERPGLLSISAPCSRQPRLRLRIQRSPSSPSH